MKGYVTQKKSNKLYYPVIYRGQDNITKKKDYKWGSGYIKKKDAETALAKMVVNYSDNGKPVSEDESLKYIYEQWLELVVPEIYHSLQSVATAKGYVTKHVLPYFEKVSIDEIGTQDIQKFLFKLRIDKTFIESEKKVRKKALPSTATKRKIFSILNSIFDSAKNWGYILKNPCEGIELKSPETPIMEVWTPEDTYYFLGLDEVRYGIYYLPFLLLATTGMRRSEVCGLRWNDYDGSTLFLQHGLDTSLNETDLKTKASHRRIQLMGSVVTIMEEQKAIQSRISSTLGLPPRINGYIITDEKNDVINPYNLTKIFRKIIHDNNLKNNHILPVIRLHDLRHGFATTLLYNDTNIKVVSEMLGHAKTSTTQNIYQAAATRTMQSQAVEKLEDILFKKGQEKRQEKEERA